MLLADDMIHLAAEESVFFFNEAVFAESRGSLAHHSTERGADITSTRPEACKGLRKKEKSQI